MSVDRPSIGIIGGSGMLGSAIARCWLDKRTVAPKNLWISNRSGKATGFETWPEIHVTDDSSELCRHCEIILLSVPPAAFADVTIQARDRLVLSVMAGITIDRIRAQTGGNRIIRAMSSPAAAMGLAYSPWCASPGASGIDRRQAEALFEACGLTDELTVEEHLDCFTALTGPVPGFVACFADCMVQFATRNGIPHGIAVRAIRQLFLASGRMLAEQAPNPAEHVQGMIDYAGTTAAGLMAMQKAGLAGVVFDGLDAAVEKARRIGA